ncbi:MAG: GNAT family N-acetyltransferase [Hyphomicrobium sp.]
MAEFGEPIHLPQCEGWVLKRPITDTGDSDAMGCYPMFACGDWSRLADDVERLMSTGLVALSLVPDPFGEYDEGLLKRAFPDYMLPLKEHFVVELRGPIDKIPNKHHRYYTRKAMEELAVDACENTSTHVENWVHLYATLTKRHNISGIRAFSAESFALQLNVPGAVMFRALHQGEMVGAHIWYVSHKVATSHLAAFSEKGYELMASYALYWKAIEYFQGRVQWMNLGAAAGTAASTGEGLARFKRGWATGTRTAFICGRVLNATAYDELARATETVEAGYFPCYREGEFD